MSSQPNLEESREFARQYQLAMHNVPHGVIVSVGWQWPDVKAPPICRTSAIIDIPPPTTPGHVASIAAKLTQSLRVAVSALAESFHLDPEAFVESLDAALQREPNIAEVAE
jgi:hypothetical protein